MNPMPVLVIQARDPIAVSTMRAYRDRLVELELYTQSQMLNRLIVETIEWQQDNPLEIKLRESYSHAGRQEILEDRKCSGA